MAGPLEGIMVLDLGRFAAAPVCARTLADLGAEVIRVERPGGEEDRYHGLLSPGGDNYIFMDRNANKKGITLNFMKSPEARKILLELVKRSDIVVENFSPEAAKAIGATYENFKAVKPDLIFAHVSGFGSNGPDSKRLCFDPTAKAISGSMAISGFPGVPLHDQITWVDYGTAHITALGILAALYHRKVTGQGQMVETSLMQTIVGYMAPVIAAWETAGVLQPQAGNRIPFYGINDTYQAKDGKWVTITVITNPLWRRFCKFIGREDLVNDSRFHNDMARWEHRDIIDPIIKEWIASRTADEVITAADAVPIPCGICKEVPEIAHDPQIIAMKMLTEVPFAGSGKVIVSSPPVALSETRTVIRRSFPAVGQHNEEIYCGLLGYSRDDLARLKQDGAI